MPPSRTEKAVRFACLTREMLSASASAVDVFFVFFARMQRLCCTIFSTGRDGTDLVHVQNREMRVFVGNVPHIVVR
jgi:hypothetical protein